MQSLPLAGKSVLDIGTGQGQLATVALELGARRVVGVDRNSLQIAQARALVPTGHFIHAEAADYLSRNERFDLVLANLPESELFPLLPAMTDAGRQLVLGGIRATAPLRNALHQQSRTIVATRQSAGWYALNAS